MRSKAVLVAAAALAAFVVLCAQAMAARSVTPLPASDYTVSSVCAKPTPGNAGCLALRLVPETSAARAHTRPLGMTRTASSAAAAGEICELPTAAEGCFGLRPQDLHTAYELPTGASSTQTIAVIAAYNDPHAEADLETYDKEFNLPQCTTADGCFAQLNQNGEHGNLPFPTSEAELQAAGKSTIKAEREKAKEAEGWSAEISLDIETARATCQNCHIMLVEANSPAYTNLEATEESAVRLDADEVSNSWGGPECEPGRGCFDDGAAFNHPGVVITASAGDDGYLNWLEAPQNPYASYPASSPHVVAVGGTRLELGENGERVGESVWNDGGESEGVREGPGAGGGGCSVHFAAPPWQRSLSDWSSVGCSETRAVADVSADADPYTGLAVYDTSPECEETIDEEDAKGNIVKATVHWCVLGGTSLASPLIASVFALAGGAHGVEYPAETLYENAARSPSSLHDVTEGSNGRCTTPFDRNTASTACTPAEEARTSCSSELICLAGAGYDGPTGLGTPDGIAAFEPTATPANKVLEEATRRSEEEAAAAATKSRQEEEATAKKHEEEASAAATKKRREEEAAVTKKSEEAIAATTGSVWLNGSIIMVQTSGKTVVKLMCRGTDVCRGKLTLMVRSSTTRKGKTGRAETIGTASFSIPAGKTATVKLTLNAGGRVLLSTDHGRMSASLAIVKSSPAPSQTLTEGVRLVQGKASRASPHRSALQRRRGAQVLIGFHWI
jgi:Subtilase family